MLRFWEVSVSIQHGGRGRVCVCVCGRYGVVCLRSVLLFEVWELCAFDMGAFKKLHSLCMIVCVSLSTCACVCVRVCLCMRIPMFGTKEFNFPALLICNCICVRVCVLISRQPVNPDCSHYMLPCLISLHHKPCYLPPLKKTKRTWIVASLVLDLPLPGVTPSLLFLLSFKMKWRMCQQVCRRFFFSFKDMDLG